MGGGRFEGGKKEQRRYKQSDIDHWRVLIYQFLLKSVVFIKVCKQEYMNTHPIKYLRCYATEGRPSKE